jgi:very-short-patch-repair endonuclease
MAAVLACGKHALLSHLSAAAHWGIVRRAPGAIHVTVPAGQAPRRPGIKVHRRAGVTATSRDGIPLTGIVDTLVDIAPDLSDTHLERAINEAVNRDLIDPERLRASLPRGRPGVRRLTRLLDRSTYVTTETILEQRMLRIALRAGLPKPEAQRQLGGARVDFVWPALKLIVEADSLRFHRTTLQQQADGLRDQRHAAAGFLPLRFTHYQIMFEPDHVERTLRAVARNSSRQLRQPYHTIPD